MMTDSKEGGREGGREVRREGGSTCCGLRRHQMTVLRPTIMVLTRSLPERRLSFISTLRGEWREGNLNCAKVGIKEEEKERKGKREGRKKHT